MMILRKLRAFPAALAFSFVAFSAVAQGVGGNEISQPQDYPGYCSKDWTGKTNCFENADRPWQRPGPVQSVAHLLSPAPAGASTSDRHFCGAALVAPNWAITSAHCARRIRRVNGYEIGIGTSDWRDGALRSGVVRPIEEVIIHPDYRSGQHDIALVRFSEDPSFHIANPANSPANPVTYGTGNFEFPRPISARMPEPGAPDIPFSDTSTGGVSINSVLMRWSRLGDSGALHLWDTPLFEMPRNLCNQMQNAGDKAMHENVFCAVSHERGICPADAGAPVMGGSLVAEYDEDDRFRERPNYIYPRELLVGAITSWNKRGCAEPGEPGRFTLVRPYVPWIREVLKETYDRRKDASVPFSNLGPKAQEQN